ncbi:hypothetical protein AMAG_13339 [Allomyces macrogynus ATCC 38327]|uniref:Protein FAM184A/B N-terminal domain-containing protein n=1 Tax=Allomyces macrogynus (strain ATCC 38327) TaxID=578462 RepID=A0A0L0T239_ALLM3|nr:hypothetical protein AMAG_13339 [Allomyces macrogynus ATCC 38327]|eukprot:KNE68695.1 hypothetical protein AMAG_13339 [Allomyces macrogynus ATCC 38327]
MSDLLLGNPTPTAASVSGLDVTKNEHRSNNSIDVSHSPASPLRQHPTLPVSVRATLLQGAKNSKPATNSTNAVAAKANRGSRTSLRWTTLSTSATGDVTAHHDAEDEQIAALLAEYPIDATPELLFKLSKKVAQLTKVIYQVNLENDHHHAEVADIVESYEAALRHEEETAIRLTAEVKRLFEDDLHRAVVETQAVRDQLDQECEAARVQLAKTVEDGERRCHNLEMKHQDAVSALVLQHGREVDQLQCQNRDLEGDLASRTMEVHEVRAQVEEQLKELERSQQLLEREQSLRHQDLQAHDRELEAVRQDAARQLDQLSQSNAANLARIRQQHHDELTAARSEIAALQAAVAARVEDSDTAISALRLAYQTEVTSLRGEHESANATISELQAQVQTAQSTATGLTHQLAEAKRTETALRDQLTSTEASLEHVRDDLAAARRDLDSTRAQLDAQRHEFSDQRKRLAAAHRSDLETLVQAEQGRRREADAAHAKELAEMKDRSDAMASSFKSERTRLERAAQDKDRQIRDVSAKLLEMERTMQLEREQLETRIRELESEVEVAQEECRSQQAQGEQSKESIIEAWSNRLETQAAEWRHKCTDLEAQVRLWRTKYEDMAAEGDLEASTLRENMAAASAHFDKERQTLIHQIERSKANHAQAERAQDELRQQLRDAQGARDQDRQEFEKSVAEARREHDGANARLAATRAEADTLKHQLQQLDLRRQALEGQVDQLRGEGKSMSDRIAELTRALAIAQEEQAMLKNEVQSARNLGQQEVSGLQERAHKAEADATEAKTRLATANARVVSLLQIDDDHRAKLVGADKRFAEQAAKLDQLQAQLEEAQSSTARVQVELDQRAAEAAAARSHAQQLEADHARQLAAAKADFEKQLKSNDEEHHHMEQELKSRHRKELESMREKHAALESRIKAQEAAVATVRNEVVQAKRAAAAQLEQERANLNDQLSHARARHESELAAVRAEFQQERESIQRNHLFQTNGMLEDFEAAKQFFESEIQRRDQDLQSAEHRYQHREPRTEDLERIRELETTIIARERQVAQLSAEVAQYRLEIKSREDSLNRMFNTRPNVGVVNPTASLPAGKKSGAAVQQLGSKSRSNPAILPPLGAPSTNPPTRVPSAGMTRAAGATAAAGASAAGGGAGHWRSSLARSGSTLTSSGTRPKSSGTQRNGGTS